MKLFLQFSNPEASHADEIAGGYVEIEFNKQEFLTLSEEDLFQRYFLPAIAQVKNMIEGDGL